MPAHPERELIVNRYLKRQRSLTQDALALGVEALERFTRGDPLYRVHQCAFGVLALENEPVDPRVDDVSSALEHSEPARLDGGGSDTEIDCGCRH